jgi:hypothetical protein
MPANSAVPTSKDRVLTSMERLALAHEARRQAYEARRQVPPAKRKPNKRRARVSIDKRSVLGRRVTQLTAIFRQRLGPDAEDPVLDAAIRAAETTALAEDLRARMLRGERVDPDDVLRTTRAADALTRRLHLDRHKPQQQAGPSLADILREAKPP